MWDKKKIFFTRHWVPLWSVITLLASYATLRVIMIIWLVILRSRAHQQSDYDIIPMLLFTVVVVVCLLSWKFRNSFIILHNASLRVRLNRRVRTRLEGSFHTKSSALTKDDDLGKWLWSTNRAQHKITRWENAPAPCQHVLTDLINPWMQADRLWEWEWEGMRGSERGGWERKDEFRPGRMCCDCMNMLHHVYYPPAVLWVNLSSALCVQSLHAS